MEYLTITEASYISGKSINTIRRHIQKLKEPYVKKQKTKTGFKYLISKDFIGTQMGTQEGINQSQNIGTQEPTQIGTLIEFLKEQIRQKDKQIEEINSRLKEANVINMGLQARLSLPDKKPNIFTRLFFKQKEPEGS